MAFLLLSCRGNHSNSEYNFKKSYSENFGKEFTYSPAECPFQVTFPDNPEISSEIALNDLTESLKKGESAQLEVESEQSFLRAEFLLLNRKITNQDEMKSMIEKFAKYTGLVNASLEFQKNENGTVFKLRASKSLQIENKELLVTYTAQYYFNDNSIFVLYAGCPSNSYPSLSINRFYASLLKK